MYICMCVSVCVGVCVLWCVCVCVYLLDERGHVQGGEGRLLGGFDDHRVPGAKGRGDLPGEHHHWEVPLRTGSTAERQVSPHHTPTAEQHTDLFILTLK